MVKIFHIIKEANCDTNFRIIILNALSCARNIGGKIKVHIASGFFNEIVSFPKQPVSKFSEVTLGGLSIESLVPNMDVVVFGAYNGKNDLLAFAQNLKNVGAKTKVFYKYRFHTKLFVIEINGNVVFEIIGSSNMTLSAYEGVRFFKSKQYPSYNFEADLILMDSSIMNVDIETNENVMQLKYDEKGNKSLTIQKRMSDVLKRFDTLKKLGKMKDITNELK